MIFRLKARVGIAVLSLVAFTGSAMAGNPLEDLANKVQGDFKAINDKGEADRARIRAGETTQTNEVALAVQSEKTQKKAPVIIPKNKTTAAAIDAAMPTINKILSIHQCIREPQQLLSLNTLAIAGVSMMSGAPENGLPMYSFPNNKGIFMPYHDQSKCVGIRVIDRFGMPVLNAMNFRVVYLAEDSGETVNFGFLLKKADDGSWLLAQPPGRVR